MTHRRVLDVHMDGQAGPAGQLIGWNDESASFEYDDAGRLVKMADRHDNVLAIARDNSGRATQITAPFGHKTALAYDAQTQGAVPIPPAAAHAPELAWLVADTPLPPSTSGHTSRPP